MASLTVDKGIIGGTGFSNENVDISDLNSKTEQQSLNSQPTTSKILSISSLSLSNSNADSEIKIGERQIVDLTSSSASPEFLAQVAKARSADTTKFNGTLFQKSSESFLTFGEVIGSIAYIFSGFSKSFSLITAGCLLAGEGVGSVICYSGKIQEITKVGYEKYDTSEILFVYIELINSLLLIIAGVSIAAIGFLAKYSKQMGTIIKYISVLSFDCLFGVIFCNISAVINIVMDSIKIYKSIKFRKEINQFLEDPSLSEKDKCLECLKKIRERITLTEEEENKIREKALAKIKREIKKENPRFSDNEIEEALTSEYYNNKLNVAISSMQEAKIREKIGALQNLTSKEVIEKLLNVNLGTITKLDHLIMRLNFEDENQMDTILLKESIALVKEVDRSSYLNLVSYYVDLSLGIICLLGNLVLLASNPLAGAIFWALVEMLYLVWDCNALNQFISGLVYDHGFFGCGSRKSKVSGMLPENPQLQLVSPRKPVESEFNRDDLHLSNVDNQRLPGENEGLAMVNDSQKVKKRKKKDDAEDCSPALDAS